MLTSVLPYLTVVIAMFVPLAAALYLLTTAARTTGERAVLGRRLRWSGPVPAARPGVGGPEQRRPASPFASCRE